MSYFIHSPDFAMRVSIFVTWGAGCSCVAGNIYSRYFIKTAVTSMAVQFWTRLFVVILGLLFFPKINLFHTTVVWFIASIILGSLGGIIIVQFELWNARKYFDRLSSTNKKIKKTNILESEIGEVETFQLGLCPKPQKISDWKDRSIFYIYEIKNKTEKYSGFMIVGIAILEEIIFRGYLLTMCFWLPRYLSYPTMILLIIIFGVKHIHARSREFLGKSFLAIITTVQTLVLGNVIAAAITHGYLNYYVYQQQKKMSLQNEASS